MTDPASRVTINRPEGAAPPIRRRAARPAKRSPYTSIVLILTVASTSIAVFDLFLFATGLVG
jgi:hypothetical protein